MPLNNRMLEISALINGPQTRALLLDAVLGENAFVLELLATVDEALLVVGDVYLVLKLGLHVCDSVRRLHFKGVGLFVRL